MKGFSVPHHHHHHPIGSTCDGAGFVPFHGRKFVSYHDYTGTGKDYNYNDDNERYYNGAINVWGTILEHVRREQSPPYTLFCLFCLSVIFRNSSLSPQLNVWPPAQQLLLLNI